jgi:TusA-related sulfurtransferase
MKTLNIYAALLFSIFAINFSFAQTAVKNEIIKVWGNCGMCKNKIEKFAKSAGATSASWNEETKILNISYNSAASSSEKIQKAIAASGYDTQDFKADDKAYNRLMSCCKYDRSPALTGMNGKIKSKMECKDMDCCKDKGCCDKNGKCDNKTCKEASKCKNMECCKS